MPAGSGGPLLKRSIKSLAGRLLFETGLARRRLRRTGVVVAFHRVNDATAGDPLTVSVPDFERFCRFFRRHFEVVPLGEVVARCEAGRSLGGTLAITFDDGYLDNFLHAAPVLRSLGLPATFFVVSGFIGSEAVPAWDRELDPPPRWMTWDQVRALRREGHEIGAHTRSHPDLGRLLGPEALEEMAGSRRDIQKEIDAPVELFAYPFGGREHFAEANRPLVRQAGFRCCVSCYGGTNPDGADPFRLQRVPISSWFGTPWQFGLEVALDRP